MKLAERILEKLNFPTEIFIIDKSIKDAEVSLYDLHHFLDSLFGMIDRYPKFTPQIETRIKKIEKLIRKKKSEK